MTMKISTLVILVALLAVTAGSTEMKRQQSWAYTDEACVDNCKAQTNETSPDKECVIQCIHVYYPWIIGKKRATSQDVSVNYHVCLSKCPWDNEADYFACAIKCAEENVAPIIVRKRETDVTRRQHEYDDCINYCLDQQIVSDSFCPILCAPRPL